MKKQYFVHYRADNSLARESQMIETDDVQRVRSLAWGAAKAWGVRNRANAVNFDIDWPSGETESARIYMKPSTSLYSPADIKIDSRHKFWAVLDALQAHVDNNNDFRQATGLAHLDDDERREFDAKQAAAEEIIGQMEASLAELANS